MTKRNTLTDGARRFGKNPPVEAIIEEAIKNKIPVYTRDQYGVIRDETGTIHEGVKKFIEGSEQFAKETDKVIVERALTQVSDKPFEHYEDSSKSVFDNNAIQKQLNKINTANINAHQIMFEGGERLIEVLRAHPEDRHSLHEAWGFIREEMIELEAEMMKKTPRFSQIIDEAYDVMITCARLIAFCNDKLPQEFLPDLKNKDGKYPGHEDHF